MLPLSVSCQRGVGFSQSVTGTGYYLFVGVPVVLLAIKTSKFLIRGIKVKKIKLSL
jgi:hypothetical protein